MKINGFGFSRMTKLLVDKIATLSGHRDSLYSLERSGTPSQFYSAGGDGMIVQWDLENPKDGNLVVKMANSVYAMKYVEETNMLLVGHNFNGIHAIDLANNKELVSAAITTAAIFDIQVYKNRVFVATGDGNLVVLDLTDLSVIAKIKLSNDRARSIAVLESINSIAVGYSDNTIRIIDLTTYELKKELSEHNNSVFTLLYKGEGLMLSAGRDAHVNVWDVNTWENKESIAAHMYAINHMTYSPDGKYYATCSMDKSIKVWDAKSFKLLKVIDKARHAGHGTSVNKLLWSVYNNYIVSCSDDRTISIWKLKFND